MKNSTMFPYHTGLRPEVSENGCNRIAINRLRAFWAFLLCVAAVLPVIGQTADFVINPSSVTVNTGETFTLTIQVQTTDVVSGGEVHMNFDPAVVQVSDGGVAAAGPLGIPIIAPAYNNVSGSIDYAAGTFSDPPSADFDFLTITMLALAPGTTDLVFTDPPGAAATKLTNTSGNIVDQSTWTSITVTGEDTTPPVITLLGFTTQEVTVGDVYTESGATVIDDVDGDISEFVTINSTAVDTNTPGDYFVTYNAEDFSGNPALEVIRTVRVVPIVVTTYTITATPGPNGTIDPLSAVVSAGGSTTFNILPDPGYEIADVIVNTVSQGPVASYTFTDVQADDAISATFSLDQAFQLCIASGNTDLTAFGRNFVGDPNTIPPTGTGFSRSNGKLYSGYSGPIAGTAAGSPEELFFQKEIYGGQTGTAGENPSYVYAIPVDNGFYQVDLYFSEVFHPSAGGRVFDVLLEGNVILDEYDLVSPIKDGLSTNQTAITRTYTVEVTDGTLNVQIGPASIDNGKLAGLCITASGSNNVHPVSSIGDLSLDALTAAALTLDITDSDPLSIVFNGMPASLSYDPATNQLQGTPLVTDAGTHIINAIISDGLNSPVTEQFVLTITDPNQNYPPVVAAVSDIEVAEGGTATTSVVVTDDNDVFNTTLVLYDKSAGGTNSPITPAIIVPATDYSFTGDGSGNFSFEWLTGPDDGRSYLARVTTNDGVNPAVSIDFNVHVALPVIGNTQARMFSKPLPWYGGGPVAPFTVAIETSPSKNIGYIESGEFVEYVINVPSPGSYEVEFFAGKGNGGVVTVTLSEENGGAFSPIGSFGAIQTDWQVYAPYTFDVEFANTGIQTLRLDFSGSGGVNIRDFNFVPSADNPPAITSIDDIEVDEGEIVSVDIQVTDDFNPAATIVLYDKSATGGTNSPFIPATAISGYSFTDNGSGSYTLLWNTAIGDGRSYEARVTANDGTNPPVTETFTINVAQDIPDAIFARTFSNPLPWYGASPVSPFTVSIENAGNIGYIDPNDFTEYLIDVPAAGLYTLRVNASNGSGGANVLTISEENGGGFTPLETVTVNNNGWGSYADYTGEITFSNPGLQTLRFDYSGGMNITEFELIPSSENATPVVTITSPAGGTGIEEGIAAFITATAIDNEEGDISAALVWNSSLDGNFGTGGSVSTAGLSVGTHVITASVTDNDPTEPKTASASITIYIGTPAPDCDMVFRVNAGGTYYLSATGNFEGDQSAANAGGEAQNGTPSSYVNTSLPANDTTFGSTAPLISNTTGYPDYLFQTERWSSAVVPDNMQWAFPTGNGTFTVDVLFNENWTGESANPRVFDMNIEGNTELDNYRPSVNGSEINIAKVESFTITVTDGVMNIDFIAVSQNPAVKGFSICAVPVNAPPMVSILTPSEDDVVTRGAAVTISGTASDPEDGDISASINWTSSDPLFIPTPVSGTGAAITAQFYTPGPQTLMATVTDSGLLSGSSTITVNVSGPAISFTAPSEAQVLNSTTVDVTVSPTDVFFSNDERFHFYINPPDPDNPDFEKRISTASTTVTFDELSGLLASDNAGNGIVTGQNTLVVVVADQSATEFTNPEARAVVNFTVDLPDNEPPTVICPADIALNNDAGNCNAEVSITDPTATDNVSTTFIYSGIRMDGLLLSDPYPVGETTIVWTAEDEAGNVSLSCDQLVTIADTEAPLAACQDFTLELNSDGLATLSPSDINGGSTDNCEIDTYSADKTSFGIADIGLNTVTLTVTDIHGISSTCTATVNVTDGVAPEAVCTDIEVALDENGVATIVAGDLDGGSSDASGIAEFSASQTSFSCADLGENSVMLTVTDSNGNSSSCSATVTVVDTLGPVITCNPDISVTSSNGNPVVITIDFPTATDNCDPSPTVTAIRSDNASLTLSEPFEVGTTQIQWTALDSQGNPSVCVQDITVNYTPSTGNDIVSFDVPGQIGNETIDTTEKTVVLLVAAGTDVTTLIPTIGISPDATINPISGTPRDFSTSLPYTVTAQNNAEQVWTVTVNIELDTEPPTVTCPDPVTVGNDAGQCGALVSFTLSFEDNLEGGMVTSSPASGTVFAVGVTTVNVTATDAAGNEAFCSFDVTVNDTEAPVITCPADQELQGDIAGSASLADYTSLAGLTDNCDTGMTVVQTPVPGTEVSGIVPVQLATMDTAGNSHSCVFEVTVVPQPPTPSLTITPSLFSVSLPQGGTSSVNYVVDSDDASSLPTPAAMTLTDNDTGLAPLWVTTTSAANQGTPYELDFNTGGLAPGTYSGTLTAGPVTGYNDVTVPITLEITPVVSSFAVTSFTLVNAINDEDILTLLDGDVIDITSLPTTNLNIRANTTSDVRSVGMQLSGSLTKSATENVAPFALYGDSNGNYAGTTFIIGGYNLGATAYSGANLGGTAGTALNISFQLTDQDPACLGFAVSITASNNPTTCNGANGSASAVIQGGNAPYSYLWDNGNTNATVTNLNAGSHSVTVTDGNGCSSTASVSLTNPPLPLVTLGTFGSVLTTDAPVTLSGGSPAGGTYSGSGVSGGSFNPAVAGPGTHPITYSYTNPSTACTNTAVSNITVNSPTSNAALVIVNANTDQPWFALTNGLQIDKNTIGNTPLGVIFNVNLNPGGVVFQLNGPINKRQAEGASPPYSLFGDIGNNILGQAFPVGNYTLSANPRNGPTIVVNFSVISGPPVNQAPNVVATGNADPSIPFRIQFSSAGSTDNDGVITAYNWNFGDGSSSTDPNPVHTYATGGSKTVSLTLTDDDGESGSTTINVIAADPNDVDRVVSFVLINAVNDTDISELHNNDFISGTGINIRANTAPGIVGSVRMVLSGQVNKTIIESVAPYALYGDEPGPPPNYNTKNLPNGNYSLTATPYALAGAQGAAGQALTINFTIGPNTAFARVAPSPLKISPNPADREVTMDFISPVAMVEIVIYDVSGRLVKTIKPDAGAHVSTYLMEVQDLAPATYFVRVLDNSGGEFQQPMVIKRN